MARRVKYDVRGIEHDSNHIRERIDYLQAVEKARAAIGILGGRIEDTAEGPELIKEQLAMLDDLVERIEFIANNCQQSLEAYTGYEAEPLVRIRYKRVEESWC